MRSLLLGSVFLLSPFCAAQAFTPTVEDGREAIFMDTPMVQVASGGGGYTGPGDTLSGAQEYWGLDAVNAAYRGSKAVNVCLPSDTACADVNTSGTTGLVPNTVTISATTCNNTTVICTIKTFYGQVTGNNQTQTTIANRATFVTSCIGSNPCAGTTTTTNYESTSNVTVSGTNTNPYTFIGAAERTSNPTSSETGFILGVSYSVTVLDFAVSANTVAAYAGATLNATAADGSFHTLQAEMNAGSSNVYVDGTVTSGSTGNVTNAISQQYYIIGDNSSTGTTGNFLGAGLWDNGVTSGQAATISTNYHSRWGY